MFFEIFLGNIELDITIKLLLAALAGGLVGFEREKHGRPAGLRTNLLVAVGSCVMMIVSEAFYLKYSMFDAETTLRLDPSRVAAQIVTGIGFIYSLKKREVWSRRVCGFYQKRLCKPIPFKDLMVVDFSNKSVCRCWASVRI